MDAAQDGHWIVEGRHVLLYVALQHRLNVLEPGTTHIDNQTIAIPDVKTSTDGFETSPLVKCKQELHVLLLQIKMLDTCDHQVGLHSSSSIMVVTHKILE